MSKSESTRQRFIPRALICVGAAVALVSIHSVLTRAHAPSGAVFTTLDDGSRVNANIYSSKKDVYLDGGPGPNAPQDAAGLDDGIYVFQVTDPSGKVLLSSDSAACRIVEVSDGVITNLLTWDGAGTDPSDFEISDGNNDCHKRPKNKAMHHVGVDEDYGPPAIVVQLMPYDDTPNPGGVYKVWMTRIADFLLGANELGATGESALTMVNAGFAPGNFHGFLPAHSKTDNFKVREKGGGGGGGGGGGSASLTVLKYCDLDCDGVQDAGDAALGGVDITVTDSEGNVVCSGTTVGGFFDCTLPGVGVYTVSETLSAEAVICGASVDGVSVGATTDVNIEVTSNRQVVVVTFGNTAANGELVATKYCETSGEPVDGIVMNLSGVNILGDSVSGSAATDSNGQVSFTGLLAGDYTVTEIVPDNFVAIGSTTCNVTLAASSSVDPQSGENTCEILRDTSCVFSNVAVGNVGARTPGFWCVQTLREGGENNGTEAACYERIQCLFDFTDDLNDDGVAYLLGKALALTDGAPGLASNFVDLDGNGSISNDEAQLVLCPQEGDAEKEQCRRQALAFLLNIAIVKEVDAIVDDPDCGSGCETIGVALDQRIVVDGALTTVQEVFDALLEDGCSTELHALIQGINENTITVLDRCPSAAAN